MIKILKSLKISAFVLCFVTAPAFAQDITAVDFSGDVIGKVIPDGTAVNSKNQIIGQLTTDGFLTNSKGDIIGGIVPQGFAVSNDHKYLGKVSGDGSVRLPSGKIAGKVLPNGLVVDEFYDVLGKVLSAGIVYDDLGKAVGRLAGNGSYVNFDGKSVGFVSPSGFAYKQTATGYVLDGKLISAKMVVSLAGDFIGSVAPGGQVVDFDGHFIGKLHANGYVYDKSEKVIGRIVKASYAFNNQGQYLGFVSYNGEVVNKGKVVGKLRADNKIADLKGQVVGFAVDMNTVALSSDGKYLGYLAPEGKVIRGQTEVGHVGAHGLVFAGNGDVLGQIAAYGPIFDYLGNVKAEAMPNGHVVSLEGSVLGFMRGNMAFDNAGFMLGETMSPSLIMSSSQKILGLTGIGSEFVSGSRRFKVSPLGYVYTSDNVLAGETISLAPSYAENGDLVGFIDINGNIEASGFEGLRVINGGLVVDKQNEIKARQIYPAYAVSYQQAPLVLSETNLLYDDKGRPVAKVVPEYDVVDVTPKGAVMPVVGEAGKQNGIVLDVRGDMVGYVDEKGQVIHAGKNMGSVVSSGIVLSSKNSYLGEVMPFAPVVNGNCDAIGVVSSRGEVRSGRDNVVGKILLNGQVVSEVGQNMGYAASSGPVYGFDGALLGFSNEHGKVFDRERQALGCLNWDGRLYEDGIILKGHLVENKTVMNFDNNIIGRVNLNNQFIDNEGTVAGFLTPDGTVLNEKNKKLGLLFKYKVAFDRDNNFVGYVTPKGQVYDDKKELFGTVTHDGLVVSKNKAVGYALYDLYVYDEKDNVIGYLTKNGSVMNFSGQNIGKADRGFLVSGDGRLIGRGHRDYFVRDKNNAVLGEILLPGKVMSKEGVVIGSVTNNGDIRTETGKVIGTAKPLQYYVVKEGRAPDWAHKPEKIQVTSVDVSDKDENEPLKSYNQKVVGVVISPDGNYLGKVLETGLIIDDNGNEIGFNKDGIAFDFNDNIIGSIEVGEKTDAQTPSEIKPVESQPSQMFLPSNAYSTADDPTDLGPGGGYGPNERYDPIRSQILSQAQTVRVEDIKVGKISSNINPSSFTGYQDNWDNANYTMSSWRVDMSEMILADKPIPAVLARTIMDGSESSGVPITAIVERNVYAEDGRNIVIPAGSRVMGESGGMSGGGGDSGGAVRVGITWTRLIRPDGSAFEFAQALTGDAQGRGGALGYLDEQLLKRYLLPVTTDMLSKGIAYLIPGGKTTTSSDGASTQDSKAAAAEQIRQSFLTNMDQIFQDIMQRKTNIEAVTYVPAGTRLIIYPKVDLWLRTVEREKSGGDAVKTKPQDLLNPANPSEERSGGRSSSGSSGGSSSTKVTYSGESANVEPSTPPLMDESSFERQRNQRRMQQMGALPPPSTSVSNRGNQQSEDSSASLF